MWLVVPVCACTCHFWTRFRWAAGRQGTFALARQFHPNDGCLDSMYLARPPRSSLAPCTSPAGQMRDEARLECSQIWGQQLPKYPYGPLDWCIVCSLRLQIARPINLWRELCSLTTRPATARIHSRRLGKRADSSGKPQLDASSTSHELKPRWHANNSSAKTRPTSGSIDLGTGAKIGLDGITGLEQVPIYHSQEENAEDERAPCRNFTPCAVRNTSWQL